VPRSGSEDAYRAPRRTHPRPAAGPGERLPGYLELFRRWESRPWQVYALWSLVDRPSVEIRPGPVDTEQVPAPPGGTYRPELPARRLLFRCKDLRRVLLALRVHTCVLINSSRAVPAIKSPMIQRLRRSE
jgi:hypothetical protein